VSPCKISEQNFENKGSFFFLKILKKFPGLATSSRHISAMITNAKNSRPNGLLRKKLGQYPGKQTEVETESK